MKTFFPRAISRVFKQARGLALCLCAATILSSGMLSAQSDPGPRSGSGSAGSFFPALNSNEQFFSLFQLPIANELFGRNRGLGFKQMDEVPQRKMNLSRQFADWQIAVLLGVHDVDRSFDASIHDLPPSKRDSNQRGSRLKIERDITFRNSAAQE